MNNSSIPMLLLLLPHCVTHSSDVQNLPRLASLLILCNTQSRKEVAEVLSTNARQFSAIEPTLPIVLARQGDAFLQITAAVGPVHLQESNKMVKHYM